MFAAETTDSQWLCGNFYLLCRNTSMLFTIQVNESSKIVWLYSSANLINFTLYFLLLSQQHFACTFCHNHIRLTAALEPSCCKKRQKKSQSRNWFGELGTSEGSEWSQIDPKWLRGSLIVQNLQVSPIPQN